MSRTRGLSMLSSGMALVLLAGFVHAQDDGLSVKVGEADLYPSVRVDYVSIDNAFLTSDNESEASGVEIAPSLKLIAQRRLLELEFRYEGTYGSFDEDALNFDDHLLGLTGKAELNSRKRLFGLFSVRKEHEELGDGLTRGLATPDSEVVNYVTVDAVGAYTYGALSAKGNLEAGLAIRNRSFQNQSQLTDGQDYTRIMPYGQFTYRLSDRARALLELSFANYDYSDPARDRSDISLKTGLVLSETGKSGGNVQIGATRATHDQSEREDTTELVANVSLFYLPIPASRFTLTVERGFDDVEGGLGSQDSAAVVEDQLRLDWQHGWSARVTSRAFVERVSKTRGCPDPDTQTVSTGFELGLGVRRWLELGAGIKTANREAEYCSDAIDSVDLEYDRQRINVFVRATL